MPGPFARNFELALFSRAGEFFSRDAESRFHFDVAFSPGPHTGMDNRGIGPIKILLQPPGALPLRTTLRAVRW